MSRKVQREAESRAVDDVVDKERDDARRVLEQWNLKFQLSLEQARQQVKKSLFKKYFSSR